MGVVYTLEYGPACTGRKDYPWLAIIKKNQRRIILARSFEVCAPGWSHHCECPFPSLFHYMKHFFRPFFDALHAPAPTARQPLCFLYTQPIHNKHNTHLA